MLAGGDYDGDGYYVTDEPLLVNSARPVQACDFGSQKEDHKATIAIDQWFAVPKCRCLNQVNQELFLNVLHKYIGLGNIVASSSDAWLRLADRHGVGHADALKVALVCQKALDALKLSV